MFMIQENRFILDSGFIIETSLEMKTEIVPEFLVSITLPSSGGDGTGKAF